MAEKQRFEMSEEQYRRLLDACKPVTYITGSGGVPPRSPQENANDAWRELGEEMGFDFQTVSPGGPDQRVFYAVPTTAEGQA